MKKHIITILGVYLALQGLYSCNKKFLDEKLYSYYAPETLTDSLGFEAAEIGLYYQMELFLSKSDAQGWPRVQASRCRTMLAPCFPGIFPSFCIRAAMMKSWHFPPRRLAWL